MYFFLSRYQQKSGVVVVVVVVNHDRGRLCENCEIVALIRSQSRHLIVQIFFKSGFCTLGCTLKQPKRPGSCRYFDEKNESHFDERP